MPHGGVPAPLPLGEASSSTVPRPWPHRCSDPIRERHRGLRAPAPGRAGPRVLDVERGEVLVFLVGASGSGKSRSCASCCARSRRRPVRVFVAGRRTGTLSSWRVPHLRRQIGAVFQDFRLLPNKTVFENVAFALQVIGKPRHHILTTVPDVLEMVGLSGKGERRPPGVRR